MSPTDRVLNEIFAERQRQTAKWGDQGHLPDGYDLGTEHRELEEAWARASCDFAADNGGLTWLHVAREEWCEALAARDERSRREELKQLAAVVVAWIEAIDTRGGNK